MAERLGTVAWIKMRADLLDNPKVVAMARALHGRREFREWLTPGGSGPMNGPLVSGGALRCVTVGLLVRVWSSSREHGHFEGDDLVLPHNTVSDLDEIAGAPGVGAAMIEVGWAVEKNGVTLPRFKVYNVPKTPAEKQKDYRERVAERVTRSLPSDGNETVTRTEQNRQTEETVTVKQGDARSLLSACLRAIGVGEPARSVLADCPSITVPELTEAWRSIQENNGLSNPLGALVAAMQKKHGLVIPKSARLTLSLEDREANGRLRTLRERRRA